MRKSVSPDRESSPIFLQLQEKKLISAEEYDHLWKVMRNLGYSDFLTPEQGMITLRFLRGENVFGVLPTSGGKSFTFQTVARMSDGLTVIISPLIALMNNQVAKFRDGASLYFNSDLSPWEKKEVRRRIREGKVKLLYISPERLKSAEFKELLDSGKQQVKRLVIDEAHCVVEWGYGFRVKYLHIAQEIDAFEKRLGSSIPVLLLTATASPWLQRETVRNLQIDIPAHNFITQRQGIDRPELTIRLKAVSSKTAKVRWLAKQLTKGGKFHKKRGIIFSAFAKGGNGLDAYNAPEICQQLEELGVKRVDCYHGSMGLEQRRQIQKEFQDGEINILIATKAFGMGIDLPKLDFIIHFYPPISLEEYWQEAGRGGRGMSISKDECCECVVLHNSADYKRLEGFHSFASFGKILSTFTSAASGEIFLNTNAIRPTGELRKLLSNLQSRKDIGRLKRIRANGKTYEHWKLKKPARVVVRHIEALFKSGEISETKQTKRLRNNLRIRANRKGKIIRIESGSKTKGPALEYYNSELNWFTEPELTALSMLDDEVENNRVYTRFRLLKDKLMLKDIKLLSRKLNSYRKSGQAKLDYVFNHFLNAKNGNAKRIILDYLALKKKPA